MADDGLMDVFAATLDPGPFYEGAGGGKPPTEDDFRTGMTVIAVLFGGVFSPVLAGLAAHLWINLPHTATSQIRPTTSHITEAKVYLFLLGLESLAWILVVLSSSGGRSWWRRLLLPPQLLLALGGLVGVQTLVARFGGWWAWVALLLVNMFVMSIAMGRSCWPPHSRRRRRKPANRRRK